MLSKSIFKFHILFFLLFFGLNQKIIAQNGPTWQSNFPSILHGAVSMDIKVKTNNATIVYYAIYKNDQNTLTAASVKSAALSNGSNGNGNLQQNGSIIIGSSDTAILNLTGFTNDKTYYVYLSADNGSVSMANSNVYKETVVLPKRQKQLSYTSNPSLGDGQLHGYLLYYPEEYYKNPNQDFPLLIVLHGIGERGTLNYSALNRYGPAKLVDGGRSFPFIIATPQTYIYAGSWAKSVVNEFLDKMVIDSRVNINKIYVTGFSMGGNGAFAYAAGYPNKVTAIVPIAGWSSGGMCNLTNVPVWAFHAQDDGSVGVAGTNNAVANINACNPPPTVPAIKTIYPNGGHGIWEKTYNGSANHDIYTWMLQYTKNLVAVPGVPPVVSAGANKSITAPANTITLFGSASDPNGIVVSYSWTKISGPSVTLGAQNVASLQLSNLVAGVYVFRLTATDNTGDIAFSEATLTVLQQSNIGPTAYAGSDQTLVFPQNSVTLLGNGTDPDGTITTYLWKKLSGPSTITIGSTNSQNLVLTNIGSGTYTFRLSVTDNDGDISFDDVTIAYFNNGGTTNLSPVANAGNDKSITLPTTAVTIVGNASDSDGTIATYSWTKQSGGVCTLTNPNSASLFITGLQVGVYVFRLSATDNSGAIDEDDVTVTVNSLINQAPIVSILSPTTNFVLLQGNPVQISVSAIDNNGTISKVELYDGNIKLLEAITSPFSFLVNNLSVGYHQLSVKAVDNLNLVSQSPIVTVQVISPITCSGTGFLLREQWNNIQGNNLVQTVFPTLISSSSLLTMAESGQNISDNFQSRMRGYICPPMSGNYIFYISGDDNCELFLSTGAGSGSKTKIASISGFTNYRELSKYSSQTSLPISLVAGQKYYIEVLHKEGTGFDNVSVSWKLPDGTLESPISGSKLSPYINLIPFADAGGDQMEVEGVNSIVLNSNTIDLDGSIVSYIWTKISGPSVSLSGTSLSSLTINNPTLGNYKFLLLVKDNSGATSIDTVSVTVIQQNLPPIAKAGPDRYIFANAKSLNLRGTATDPDGTIASISWTQISGPSVLNLVNSNTIKVAVSNYISGTYTISLTVIDNDNDTTKDEMKIFISSPSSSTIYRVNAGGSHIVSNPVDWDQDLLLNQHPFLLPANVGFVTGKSVWAEVNKTGAPDQIFKTYRYHTSSIIPLTYEFPVNNGDFEVRLYFAENNANVLAGITNREFDVYLEGKKFLDNLNVMAEADSSALVKTFYLNVTDNFLDIEFVRQLSNPIISGIEISELLNNGGGKREVILNENESVIDFEVYPNPFTNQITVQLSNDEEAVFKLTDILGREILVLPIAGKESFIQLDKFSMPVGFYFYNIQLSDGKIITGKILKEI